MQDSRRSFIRKSALAAGAIAATPLLSYGRNSVLGANDKVNFAIFGLHGRGNDLRNSIAANDNTNVKTICDVDKRQFNAFSAKVLAQFGKKPVWEKDYRKVLEDKDIDVVVIATPEHLHAPMAIDALKAGKHVYVEKPCAHNPAESEMLVRAQLKYGGLVQMGNQQRSSDHTKYIIKKIHEGLIGKAYMGKAWYSNKRGSIGTGKESAVPDYLDWDLWQGPAPRKTYMDNIHPYNWHWFWHWGTGETLNNGTHEVDLCRWALEADMPKRITADGGRYHYADDWQFYDTLISNFDYGDKMITWEGKSCNAATFYNRGRGALIIGTAGSVLIDRNGFIHMDVGGKIVEEYKTGQQNDTMNIRGGGEMTDFHFQNLLDGIRKGIKLNSDIHDVYKTVQMLLLANVAWKTGQILEIDAERGQLHDKKLMKKYWGREYENGWEPKV